MTSSMSTLGSAAGPGSPVEPTRADLDALIAAERVLLDGVHSAERGRLMYGAAIRVPDAYPTAYQDWTRRMFRPEHFTALTRLRDHLIDIRSDLVDWGPTYIREFPWWPRSASFDVWADAQTLSQTRMRTGDALKWLVRDASQFCDQDMPHALGMTTLLGCLGAYTGRSVVRPTGRVKVHRVGAPWPRFTESFAGYTPRDGFTRAYTAQFGPQAPLAWAAGLTPAQADVGLPDRAVLITRAHQRGYRNAHLLPDS